MQTIFFAASFTCTVAKMESGQPHRAPSQSNSSHSAQLAPIYASPVIGRDQTVLPRLIPTPTPIGARYVCGTAGWAENGESVIRAAVSACGGSPEISRAFENLQNAAAALNSILCSADEVVVMASVQNQHVGRTTTYLVYSPLLLSALCSSSWGSSIAGTAVSDAFTVVRNIAKRKAASTTGNSPAPGCGDVGRPITLPMWLGAVDPVGNDDSLAPQCCVAYILCDDQVMNRLQLAEVYALSNVYGQFFNPFTPQHVA